MNYKSAIEYLYSLQVFGIKLGLDNIKKLCQNLNNPQNSFDVIHIAGTNGKGSTSAIIASVMREAGYKTGLYTSPHLIDFTERIKIDGKVISQEFVIDFVNRLKPTIDSLKATFFEVTTALAFEYFSKSNVDVAIIETGMGGRLDATNIVNPNLCVITSISLDHTQYLGDDVIKIASEKAGIIKDRIPVVISKMEEKIQKFLIESAHIKDAPYILSDKYLLVNKAGKTSNGYKFNLSNDINNYNLRISLPGEHQIENARTALASILKIAEQGYKISDKNIKDGFDNAKWPARFQILDLEPETVLDVSHNIAGAQTLVKTLKAYFPYKSPLFVVGMMQDKDYGGFLEIISKVGGRIILTTPKTNRAASLIDMTKSAKFASVISETSVSNAVQKALDIAVDTEVVVITGSFYTVGEAMEYLDINPN